MNIDQLHHPQEVVIDLIYLLSKVQLKTTFPKGPLATLVGSTRLDDGDSTTLDRIFEYFGLLVDGLLESEPTT